MQEIKIGLIKEDFGWQRILDQEKVNWDIIHYKSLTKENYSLIILNGPIQDKIKAYLREGGAAISDENYNFSNYDGKKTIENRFGKIKRYRYGKGFLLVLPFRLDNLILNKTHKRILFPSPFIPPEELAPIVNKSQLREFIVNCFIHLHSIRNIPYVHLWYYPYGYENIFCFRMDVDEGNLEEIKKFYDISKEFDTKFTWFVNCEATEIILKDIKFLFNQDVQSHGYTHEVYNSVEENYNNLKLADKILSKYQRIIGFAAPFGKWNYSLDKSINKLNYTYSSEFALDNNTFPFYPCKDSKVLQVPIHPICIGSLTARLYSEEKMKVYYEYVLNRLFEKKLPLLLYGHPTEEEGKYIPVIRHILSLIKKAKNILSITLTDYVKWWMYRSKIKFRVFYDKDKLRITGANPRIGVRMVLPKYRESIIKLKSQNYDIRKNLNSFKFIPEYTDYNINSNKTGLIINKILSYFKEVVKTVKRRLR